MPGDDAKESQSARLRTWLYRMCGAARGWEGEETPPRGSWNGSCRVSMLPFESNGLMPHTQLVGVK